MSSPGFASAGVTVPLFVTPPHAVSRFVPAVAPAAVTTAFTPIVMLPE